ncbi:hypothetical protein BDW75DRAFT_222880 [Aspergillus navahoensis]
MSLAILWIFLLIIAAGLRQNTYFLLATGGLGIIEDILLAYATQRNLGVSLSFKEDIRESGLRSHYLQQRKRALALDRRFRPLFPW